MSLELILFWVIAFVLILDFILRGLKKKKTEKKIQNLLSDPKKEFTRNNLICFKISISIIASFIISFSYNSIVFDGIIGAVKKGYTDNLNNTLLSHFIGFSIGYVFIEMMTYYKKATYIFSFLNFISLRKKNIILFIFSIHLFKVLTHYYFYPRKYIIRPLTPAEGFLPRNQIVDTGKWVELSIEYHFKSIYSERLDLFIYSTILLSFVAWYFNDNIKAK